MRAGRVAATLGGEWGSCIPPFNCSTTRAAEILRKGDFVAKLAYEVEKGGRTAWNASS